jgi:DnaJ-class molecular chaperone
MSEDTHYDILGITSKANADEIKRAYRKLAMEWHPDKGGDAEVFNKIQEAYDCLIDDDLRKRYDLELHQNKNLHNAGFMDMFRSHMEETIWNSFSRKHAPTSVVSTIEVKLPITLFDVCTGAEKTVDFERTIFLDERGKTVNHPHLATNICGACRGSGEFVQLINNGFFVHQNVQNCKECGGVGYILINNCRLTKKKCRFRHTIQAGTLHGETYTFEQDGDIVYDKQTRNFMQGNIKITIQYDIAETNRILAEIYNFPHVSISKVEFGDIHYEYRASIFEFITGTKFNLALPDGRFILLKAHTLGDPLVVKHFGLPQITNKWKGRMEIRNLIIHFVKRELPTQQMYISESDRIILRRIMAAHYPKTVDEDAVILEY